MVGPSHRALEISDQNCRIKDCQIKAERTVFQRDGARGEAGKFCARRASEVPGG